MEAPLLRIGELAAVYDVSVKAMRLYERKGLIRPTYVDAETGYRYYNVNQIPELRVLLELKALGFTLREIGAFLSGELQGAALREALRKRRMAWQDARSVAEHRMEALDDMIEGIDALGGLPSSVDMSDEERAWLLSKLVCTQDSAGAPSSLSEAIWV